MSPQKLFRRFRHCKGKKKSNGMTAISPSFNKTRFHRLPLFVTIPPTADLPSHTRAQTTYPSDTLPQPFVPASRQSLSCLTRETRGQTGTFPSLMTWEP